MTEDECAIRGLIATWMEASKNGDLQTVLRLMADDVVFMVPGRSFGKEAFAAVSQGMKGMQFDGKSEVQEIQVLGDWAWGRTHLTVTAMPPNGNPVRRSGNTLSIFRKESGRWVLARDANMLAPDSPS